MANAFASIAGLAAATVLGRKTKQQDLARRNKMRVANGLDPIEDQPAPIDKAINWVSDKFKSTPKVDATGPVTAAIAAPAGGSEDVGLWERLKAGNIDEAGTDAYNRWGQGKTDGDAAELTREMRRGSPTDSTDSSGAVTMAQQADAPGQIQGSIDQINSDARVAELDESSRDQSEQYTTEMWKSAPDMDEAATQQMDEFVNSNSY